MSTPNDPSSPEPTQPAAPVYPAPAQSPYGQPGYAQPPVYGQQPNPYGQAPVPTGPDNRPKRLGWIALGLGIAAVVFTIVSFFTTLIAWVGLFIATLALVLGAAAIVLGIIVLVRRAEGFKLGGILAIVGGVIAGLAWFTLVTSILFTGWFNWGSMNSSEPAPVPSQSAPAQSDRDDDTDSGADAGDSAADGDYDADAFVAQVRPQLEEIMADVDPQFTPEVVAMAYTDEVLIANGELFASLGSIEAMEGERAAFVEQVISASGGMFDDDTANRFFDAMTTAAAEHLVR